MIEVEATERIEPREWEALVQDCGGHPLHFPAAHEADFDPRDRMHLVFREGPEPVACALAYRERRRRLGRGKDVLILPTAPALRPPATESRDPVYLRLLQFARDANCRELVIQSPWGASLDFPPFGDHVIDRVVEFVLDLEKGGEALLAGMHRVHRKNIRRAERDGVVVRADATLEGLLALRAMQGVSAERQAKRGSGFTVRDRAYFERIHQRVYAAGHGELLLAYRGEHTAPIAGLAYLIGAGRALTVRSGSTQEGYATYAMYLLQHEVIQRCLARGISELNIGGVPQAAERDDHPQHGLYEFKKGWGGTPLPRSSVRLELRA
ncbi:MAG TPA: peptidoglycan bridge formation glycyltransferase FemA/FemB family protein [Candidatus Eisenbacteria bacterium]|nr:peptidoglycan bridge formation glycyltransferase FemA/FemB family protein [Candidatus Eisenbacteria bacterium]